MDIVNTRLLGHPANWLIVWSVALFAATALAFAHRRFGPAAVASPSAPPS